MAPQECILALFCHVAQQLCDITKRPDAKLSPSAVVTLALLYALTGGGRRAFSRWLTRDSQALCPQVPERTRLARLFKTHTAWTAAFLAAPTVLGAADSDGIEVLHPLRQGRSPAQMGQKGKRNHRWIVGGTRCFVVQQWGVVCAWDGATAHVSDPHFPSLMAQFDDQMIVLTETGLHAKTGDSAHRKVCRRGTWHGRRVVETVLSLLTTVFQRKKVGHRLWAYFRARVAWIMAAFHILAQWTLEVDDHGMVHISIAEFSL